jgi:dipeptidyl aminopeptidase/acylaminoacyl peptidase
MLNLLGFSLVAGAGGALVFGLGLAYRGAANYTHPVRVTPAQTPADYGMPFEDARFVTEDGLRIAAWYVPSRNRAAVILVHGIGTNRADPLAFGRDLHARGYGLLLLDLRAHGDSGGSVSTLGLHEVRDVRAAFRFVASRADVDPERIGVYGYSLGAATAIMAAAEMREIRAVVADSAFASAEWLVANQFRNLVNLPPWMAPVVLAIGGLQAGVNPRAVAPVNYVGTIAPRPLFIIHGERDDIILVDNARLLAEAAGQPTETWIAPDAPHVGAYGRYHDEYLARVTQFFDTALRRNS